MIFIPPHFSFSVSQSQCFKLSTVRGGHLAKGGVLIWPIQLSINYCVAATELSTVEPRYNKPLCNKVLGITNDFLYSSNGQIYEKEPRNKETSLQRTDFASPLAFRYSEVPL